MHPTLSSHSDPPALSTLILLALSLAGLRPLRVEPTQQTMLVVFRSADEATEGWEVLERATRFDLCGDGEVGVRVGYCGGMRWDGED